MSPPSLWAPHTLDANRLPCRSAAAAAPLEGDVLRAVTCTNMVYPTKALFGAVPPERHIVLYGADKQKWAAVRWGWGVLDVEPPASPAGAA
jgi:hypothetical protein